MAAADYRSFDNDAAAGLRSRTASVDSTVASAYRGCLSGVFPKGLALLAVGGYGRRELFPFSDVDLLILTDKDIQGDAQREALSAFLRTLWDAGLRLSQSVRTIPECCRFDGNNVELSISLLDQRFLIGDSALSDQLRERLKKYFRSQRDVIIRHLCQITRTRHAKYHNTIHHLEPNIKDGPGGLRDLNAIAWLGQLREAAEPPEAPLKGAREFLWSVRSTLHARAGRDSNVLTFDIQEELSPDPAAWMREYYKHARDVFRATVREVEACEQLVEGGLIRSFRDWRGRLSNADFTVSRERVFLKNPQQLVTEPDLVLRLLEFVARHGVRLSLETERRVRDHTLYLAEYYATKRPLWPAVRRILSLPHSSLALRTMHETGLLHIVLPAWEHIECLVVRDFFHRYTVDEHTLVTIEYLEELRATREPSRRRFADLCGETPDIALLYVALLFHDTGKSEGLEGHAHVSAELARRVLEGMKMPATDQKLVLFLIENHLAVSAVMHSRDLSDPSTARELAAKVGTLERLKYLVLLTYADISAVHPEAMTPWKLEQLWRTYIVVHRELTRDLENERIHEPAEGETAAFLEGFPTRYLRTHTGEEIQAHLALARTLPEARAAVDLQKESGTWRLLVVTNDRPGLFAALAGTLAGFGMNIVKAEAFANGRGVVLDTFVFEDPVRTLELNPPEVERLKRVAKRAALGQADVGRMLRGRVKPVHSRRARVEPTVAFDSGASEAATLVEIVAQDRPCLLYDLARTFSDAGCNIDVVLIDTEAHKAIDVFYVTRDGAKLAPEDETELKRALLDVCRA